MYFCEQGCGRGDCREWTVIIGAVVDSCTCGFNSGFTNEIFVNGIDGGAKLEDVVDVAIYAAVHVTVVTVLVNNGVVNDELIDKVFNIAVCFSVDGSEADFN
ncbi:hypothetical protein NDU88_001297 [Pleurodeles waltl]|uniref:Uncharacterized protein n=1 Tax=Pleurodeles waltl TaxID=8319 RepID=A0AAV7WI09_PLEWA|nr:hypothetical protein NDU88_001297 [Pleurodeles waltl]